MDGDPLKINDRLYKQIGKLRRLLHGLDPLEATELLKERLQHTKSNKEFLVMVDKTIKGNGD